MLYLYHLLISDPLRNALIFLYNTTGHDLGIAIVLLTVVIRIILYPLFHKSARYQMKMQVLQPKIKAIQQKNKGNMRKQSEELMAMYKEHGVSPFGGFGLLLIQLPILIALYQVFINVLKPEGVLNLYPFVSPPGELNTSFIGLINLASPSILLVLLAAVAQYLQSWQMLPKRKPGEPTTSAERMTRNMAFIAPVITVVIFFRLPAVLPLYWLASSLFSILQQYIIAHELRRKPVENLPRNGAGPNRVPGPQG